MLLFLVYVGYVREITIPCVIHFSILFCGLSILLLCIQCTYVAMVTYIVIYDSFSLSELPIPSDWFNLKCSMLL